MPIDPKFAPLYKALAHPRRIKLFNILAAAKTPPNLTQLQSISKLNTNALTHHLRLMHRAGLVMKKRTPQDTKIILRAEVIETLMDQWNAETATNTKIAA
ncbi:MAG: hypothetical protein AAF429_06560 [Pseudomonadota bacterium]